MLDAVRRTAAALDLPAAYTAQLHLAELLAAAVDDMPPETRAKMLGQTAPVMLRILDSLTAAAARPGDLPEEGRRRGMTADELREFLARLDGDHGTERA